MLRNLVLGSFALLAGLWSYYFWDRSTENRRQLEHRDERIAELETSVSLKNQTITEQAEAIQRLELARQLLRLDHRIAKIEVLSQGPAADGSDGVETELLFTQVDEAGEPIGEGERMVLRGKRIYIDGMVVKFEDDYVEQGDHLRGTSVCLFERMFSEEVSPDNGIPIDRKVPHPLPFQGDNLPNPLYDELFSRIWDYANDPEAAAALGVRAIQGEAPSIEARPGRIYRVELRQSGGMTIRAE